ncbi:MAG: D-alanyl-D-alanine carboxypeptidase [Thiolinea sp.]
MAACSTATVNTPATQIPVADPLHRPDAPQRYITQHHGKMTAQQYALLAQQEADAQANVRRQQLEQQQAALRQQREQEQQAKRQQWEQEQARQEQQARQRYEAEKQRIARQRYHEQYKQEQMRLAEQKLADEKQRLIRLKYQREYELEQQRKAQEQQEATQRRLAEQREAEQQRRQLAEKRRQYQLAWERQQQQRQQPQARQQQVAQRDFPHVDLQAPPNRMYTGPGRLTRLPDTVAASLRLRGVSERGMSAYVRPASGNGPAVLTAAADVPRSPASTMKLITTYAALGVLGPNYRWPTEIYINGPVSGGTLNGDVIIKGYGNPDLNENDLRQMLQGLRGRGIRNINGNLVADISYFNVPYQNPGAFDGKPDASYNAQPEALLYQGRGSQYKFRNLGKRVARNSSMPKNPRARADLDTNLFAAFWKVWVGQMGGSLQGDFRTGVTPPQAQLAHRHQSKPLNQIIQEINKDSNNVMARQVLLTIGAEATGTPGTPRNGAMAAGRFLESRSEFPGTAYRKRFRPEPHCPHFGAIWARCWWMPIRVRGAMIS